MNLDLLNFIIKVACLFLLGAITELCLRRRFFALTIFVTGVWLTFFRLAILRAISFYVGVFRYDPASVVITIRDTFQGSLFSTFTDSVVLIGIVILFRWISREVKEEDV